MNQIKSYRIKTSNKRITHQLVVSFDKKGNQVLVVRYHPPSDPYREKVIATNPKDKMVVVNSNYIQTLRSKINQGKITF